MYIKSSWEKEIEKDLNDRKNSVIWALENGSIAGFVLGNDNVK